MKLKKIFSFTLIEMMVVIGLIALFAGLFVANYHIGGRISDLLTQTEKIAGVLKEAQIMSLTGKSVSGIRPDRGYGVYIENSHSYKLFADTSSDSTYSYDSNDKVIQSFTTPSAIEINSSTKNFVFAPPKGTVYFDGSLGAETKTITIWQKAINRYLYIKIDPSTGRIDIVSSL